MRICGLILMVVTAYLQVPITHWVFGSLPSGHFWAAGVKIHDVGSIIHEIHTLVLTESQPPVSELPSPEETTHISPPVPRQMWQPSFPPIASSFYSIPFNRWVSVCIQNVFCFPKPALWTYQKNRSPVTASAYLERIWQNTMTLSSGSVSKKPPRL